MRTGSDTKEKVTNGKFTVYSHHKESGIKLVNLEMLGYALFPGVMFKRQFYFRSLLLLAVITVPIDMIHL